MLRRPLLRRLAYMRRNRCSAPHAFHASTLQAPTEHLDWATLMYFSFTVLTSTGFGEITPVTRMARALIVIEQVLGVMCVAFLIARLANLYRNGGKHRP
jgi:hypothetical protein